MSETVGAVLATLQEMGFSEDQAKKALNKTGWKGVEPAMEWLLAHPEGQDDDDEDEEEQVQEQEQQAPKKELTEEERREQVLRLEELRVKKRQEREEQERKDALEKERRMRQEGKALSGLKREMEDQEIKRLAEERRREKEETRLHKERIKAQIEADRQARREREAELRGEKPKEPAPPKPAEPPRCEETREYTEARLQIRLPGGAPIVHTFKAKETLSAVRLFVQLNGGDSGAGVEGIKFMTSFPRRVFEQEDYEKPLDALGLVPSAVLMVQK